MFFKEGKVFYCSHVLGTVVAVCFFVIVSVVREISCFEAKELSKSIAALDNLYASELPPSFHHAKQMEVPSRYGCEDSVVSIH